MARQTYWILHCHKTDFPHDKSHVVVSVAEHSVDMNNHGSMVLQALAVVGDKELVDGVDGEVCRRFGGEGRHLSYVSALPLGGRLPWRGLQLGRHGGVVIVVGGSVAAYSVVGGPLIKYFSSAPFFQFLVRPPYQKFLFSELWQ